MTMNEAQMIYNCRYIDGERKGFGDIYDHIPETILVRIPAYSSKGVRAGEYALNSQRHRPAKTITYYHVGFGETGNPLYSIHNVPLDER